jgi:hypothetical protein
MGDRIFKTLKTIEHYDIFHEVKKRLDADVEIGETIANNITIPMDESSVAEDYANGLLDKNEYINLMINKGYIVEVI